MMKNKKKIQKLQIEIRHINKNNKLLATAEAKRVEGNVRVVSMCFDEYDVVGAINVLKRGQDILAAQ